jgi:hypothetical protein
MTHKGASAIMVSASLGIKNFADLLKLLKERSKPADLAIGTLYSSSHVIGRTLSKELIGNAKVFQAKHSFW